MKNFIRIFLVVVLTFLLGYTLNYENAKLKNETENRAAELIDNSNSNIYNNKLVID
ncbi:hypothetical protein [uncultured Winogradskyella sp.]|uniref:hypothetical protein n=1 Tax=Winogradskyella sp. 4-2091 TaxID=3381659 RepID=UPI00262A61D0|nr:hypothetical protein [uncultured Winogradskyella sp.]